MLRSSATPPLRVGEPVTGLGLDVHADDAKASARRMGSMRAGRNGLRARTQAGRACQPVQEATSPSAVKLSAVSVMSVVRPPSDGTEEVEHGLTELVGDRGIGVIEDLGPVLPGWEQHDLLRRGC